MIDSDDESSVLPPPPEEAAEDITFLPQEEDSPLALGTTDVVPVPVQHVSVPLVATSPLAEVPVQVQLQAQLQLQAQVPAPTGSSSLALARNHNDVDIDNDIDIDIDVDNDTLSDAPGDLPGDAKHMLSSTPSQNEDDRYHTLTTITPISSNSKTKIDRRLIQALDDADFSQTQRSPDLVPLTRNYQAFRKQLRALIVSIKAYRKTMEQMESARSKVFQDYASMSKSTPLYDRLAAPLNVHQTGDIENHVTIQQGQQQPEGMQLELFSETSIESLQTVDTVSLPFVQTLGQIFAKRNALEYTTFILDFALEWHDIVTSMLDQEIDRVRQLQRRRIHYERKVGALRKRTNTIEGRGKETPTALAEKLARNEQKLSLAWENHEQRAARLCVLLEEVTENGWKDLYPLVRNTFTFEVNRVSRDVMSLGRLRLLLVDMDKLVAASSGHEPYYR